MKSTFLTCLAAAFSLQAAWAETLTIYTYDSFVSDWGPGPEVKRKFEGQCGCTIKWVVPDGGAASLLPRLLFEHHNDAGQADVVLGLDTNLMAKAVQAGVVREHGLGQLEFDLPVAWDDPVFVPFDYGYFAIIYDSATLTDPPASFAELASGGSGRDLIIQDPRTSTPGLGLLLWIKAIYGDDAATVWGNLSERLLTTTRGWSEAYGLFLAGEAPMVLSYTTSPAYHQLAENETRYKAVIFPEGHYMQIEVAAVAASTDQPELARQFLSFVGSRDFAEIIPTTNWMYPATDAGDALPEVFRNLDKPDVALLLAPGDVAANSEEWIDEWLDAVGAK